MIEFKQSTARFAPVRIFDNGGNPVVGVLYSAVTATVQKADGSTATMSVGNTDWSEATGNDFTGQGVYALKLSTSALSQTGMLTYAVSSGGSNVVYIGAVKVVANEEVDTFTNLSRALGLMHENSVLDNTVFNTGKFLTAGRLRIYNSKANAQAATSTGLIATYTITANYDVNNNLQTYTVVLEP